MAWLMEQVILRLGYGIDEGLSPAKVSAAPLTIKQKLKKLEHQLWPAN